MTDNLLYGFLFGTAVEKYTLSSLKKRTPAESEKTCIDFFNIIRAKYVYSVNALISRTSLFNVPNPPTPSAPRASTAISEAPTSLTFKITAAPTRKSSRLLNTACW